MVTCVCRRRAGSCSSTKSTCEFASVTRGTPPTTLCGVRRAPSPPRLLLLGMCGASTFTPTNRTASEPPAGLGTVHAEILEGQKRSLSLISSLHGACDGHRATRPRGTHPFVWGVSPARLANRSITSLLSHSRARVWDVSPAHLTNPLMCVTVVTVAPRPYVCVAARSAATQTHTRPFGGVIRGTHTFNNGHTATPGTQATQPAPQCFLSENRGGSTRGSELCACGFGAARLPFPSSGARSLSQACGPFAFFVDKPTPAKEH